MKKTLSLFTVLSLLALLITGCMPQGPTSNDPSFIPQQVSYFTNGSERIKDKDRETEDDEKEAIIASDGSYTSKEDVALYIHTYGKLPSNFITKKEAKELGWEGGSLEEYAPGCAIGGDTFGNYEGLLPDDDSIIYTECDIDTVGASERGSKRIVFSDTGNIYYTEDHYETFTQLYGDGMDE